MQHCLLASSLNACPGLNHSDRGTDNSLVDYTYAFLGVPNSRSRRSSVTCVASNVLPNGKLRSIEAAITEYSERRPTFQYPLIERPTTKKCTKCRLCNGSSLVSCQQCEGCGILRRGGYHQKNPVNLAKILGTKWTARHPTLGRTHFHAAEKKACAGETYILMTGSCDDSVKIWINVVNLKDRDRWSAGWLERTERARVAIGTSDCKACKGTGQRDCPLCTRGGQVVEL
eukprot:jgi/Botrbrau1/5765/Bobra.0134s0033.1